MDEAVLLLISIGYSQRCGARERKIDGANGSHLVTFAVVYRHIAKCAVEAGCDRTNVDDACSAVFSVQRALRPTQDFNLLNIAQRSYPKISRQGDHDIVDDDTHRLV